MIPYLILLCLFTPFIQSQCTQPLMRKEWRELTENEKQAYLIAIQKLKARNAGDPNRPETWNYDMFVKVHYDNAAVSHSVPLFLPWHRLFTDYYEKALQSIDPSIILPYWDWSLDAQNPLASPILQPQYLGGNGDPVTHCVTTGVAAGWQVSYPLAPIRPFSSCLSRCFSFTALYPPTIIASLLNQATTYDQMRASIESGPHGTVHSQGGGQCGDLGTMYSTNDPLFFLHHAMVDKIWYRWQSGCPAFQSLYDGIGNNVSVNDYIYPWNIQVRDVLDTHKGPFCYDYTTHAGDVPLQLNCQSTNQTVTLVHPSSRWLQEAIELLVPHTPLKRSFYP